jgi:hypothetical protein
VIGGTFEMLSVENGGTEVRICWPPINQL